MHSDNSKTFTAFHEITFNKENTHIIVHDNVQNSNYSVHWHSACEILMPITNNYTAFVNNNEINLRPGDILMISPNIYHSYEAPEEGRRLFYLVDFSVIKNIPGVSQISSMLSPYVLITPEDYPEVHEKCKDLIMEVFDIHTNHESCMVPVSSTPKSPNDWADLSEMLIYTRLAEMCMLVARHFPQTIRNTSFQSANKSKRQEYVNRFTMVCNYIDAHFTEALTLEQAAEIANFSKFHFSRLFKEFTGESFYRYVNRKRIEHARHLLLNHNLTITEIALASGYSSNSVFIRMFKQFCECSPKEYRNQNRKE